MAAVTESGKTYKITKGSINAHTDYQLPQNLDSQLRGESLNAAFSLQIGDKITIVEMVRRVEEAEPDANEPKSPEGAAKVVFEVVKATVAGKEGEYYIWVVYNGVEKVEEFVEENVEPPEPDPIPDPPDPPQPIENEIQNGAEVHVSAGETVVLEVKSDGEKGEEENEEVVTGSIEVELLDEDGKPYVSAEIVHLIGEHSIHTIAIDTQGKGDKIDIPPGEYEMAMQLGTVYFDQNRDVLIGTEQSKLADISNKLTQAKVDFETIRCIGYADSDGSQKYNENLSLKRAIHVKSLLAKTQSKINGSKILTRIGGVLKGRSEEEKKVNRRVDILGLIREK
ncbi:OmpA family protein [Ekhidna sp.]|uniref:OmpA family protein n=1 Tax=Ekhidna sp. TaxID=2608089 RepID=UPI0032990257